MADGRKNIGWREIAEAFGEAAATGPNFHVAETPARLLELSQMTAEFVRTAVMDKEVSVEEMHLTKTLFNQAADKWLRQNEGR